MQKRKKLIVSLAVCLLAASLCACGASPKEEVPESPAPVSDPPSPTPAPTPTPTPEPVKQTKTGIVIEASMHTVTIEANDGSTYYFLVDDDTEVVGDGENLGDTASVEYEGDYKDNVLAIKIQVVKKAEEEVSAAGVEAQEPPAENGGTAPAPAPSTQPDTLKYITGVVKDAAMNNVTVEWNGKDYLILKDDKTSVEGDIVVGATVRVYHTGDIADGVVAVDISVVAPEIVNSDVRYITGTVVDASMNSILIENDGHVYSVLKDENTKSDSIVIGDTVRVYHKGSYADGMTATSIVKM